MKKNFRIVCLSLSLILSSQFIVAQSIILIEDSEKVTDIAEDVYFLKDSSEQFSIQDVNKVELLGEFKKNTEKVLKLPKGTKSTWIKFDLKNVSGKEMFLEIENFSIPNFEIYIPTGIANQYKIKKFGNRLPFYEKEVITNFYLISLVDAQNTTVNTYYIHFYHDSPQTVPLKIGEAKSFFKKNHERDIFYGLFLGVMSIMAMYNFFIFLSLRDITYLYYVLHIIMTSLTTLTFTGYSFNLFWPDYPLMNHYALAFTISVPLFFLILFTMSFLNTAKYAPLGHKGLFFFIFIFFVSTIISFFDLGTGLRANQLTALVLFIYLLTLAVYIFFNGNKIARFYILANGSFMLGVIVIILTASGVLPSNLITENSNQIGTIMEVLLFSFALADRIKILTIEREEAQKDNLRLVEEQKESLEEKVKERTHDLETANHEIVAQNEELQQKQEEILLQRDFINQKNNELESYTRRIKSSINAALTIQHAILPYQAKLSRLLDDYFVIFRPKDIVSGDFFWLNEVDGKRILVMADCTGHGIPGAFMTLIGNTLLDKIIRVWKITQAAEILTKLHEEVKIILRQDETGNNIGMDANIMIWQSQDQEEMAVEWAGAKHNLFYIPKNSNKIQIIKGVRKSIGGAQNERIKFESQNLVFTKGSIIYVGTDGISDQNDKFRKRLGEERFIQILEENYFLPMPEQKEKVENAINNFMLDTSQRDDMLLLGFKF